MAFLPCVAVPRRRPHRGTHAVTPESRYATRVTPVATQKRQTSLSRTSAATRTHAPDKTLPAAVANITDPAAVHMLSKHTLTPIETSLHADPIPTSHVTHLPSGTPPHASAPIVFLHGFDSNLLEYRHLYNVLTDATNEHSHRVQHYVDVLGWGFTHRPQGIAYTPTAKRAHLRAFLDWACPKQRVILVGASLGGAVAADFALEHPDRVAGLLLIDGQVYTDRGRAFMPRIIAEAGAEVLRSDWLRRLAVRMSYEQRRFWNDEVLRIGGAHCSMQGWKEATVGFILEEGYCVSERVGELSDISLVVWGERDRVLPKADRMRFVEEGFRVVTATGCGHSPHIEDPTFIATCLRELLDDLEEF